MNRKRKTEHTEKNRVNAKTKRRIKTALVILLLLLLLCVLFYSVANIIVLASAEKHIVSSETAIESKADCIIVLGAGLDRNGNPSAVLKDRLDKALSLFNKNASDRILVSGDHGQENYDETNAMKNYLIKKGVDPEKIFADHAGFSTYDTVYRAKEVFLAKKVIIVTQRFHLPRAVFIARALGLDACGVTADRHEYKNMLWYEMRESAARVKYLFDALIKPEPKYLGSAIPISGSASMTDG